MQRNRIEIAGTLEDVEALRVSPAGIPSARFAVRHESIQDEAGIQRAVQVVMRAVAVGPVAEQVSRAPAGSQVEVMGFMARAGRNSEFPVLHTQTLKVGIRVDET